MRRKLSSEAAASGREGKSLSLAGDCEREVLMRPCRQWTRDVLLSSHLETKARHCQPQQKKKYDFLHVDRLVRISLTFSLESLGIH